MARSIEVLVLTDEPFHAAYLSTVLQLELPGRFEVRQACWDGLRPPAQADLVLFLAQPGPNGELRLLPHLGGAGRPPVIVVASGRLDLDSLGRLILDGADDVIDMAHLNPRALAAAVLKAVRRRSHWSALGGTSAPASQHEGVLAVG